MARDKPGKLAVAEGDWPDDETLVGEERARGAFFVLDLSVSVDGVEDVRLEPLRIGGEGGPKELSSRIAEAFWKHLVVLEPDKKSGEPEPDKKSGQGTILKISLPGGPETKAVPITVVSQAAALLDHSIFLQLPNWPGLIRLCGP